jgi:dihydroneopterin triphosphate diphosphatase
MVRAPFQVLVLPWRQRADGLVEFALFRRADNGIWQGIAGGGEDDELPLAAAKREAFEEAGIPAECPFLALDATASIPVHGFSGSRGWGRSIYVIPEHAFGVDVAGHLVKIAEEHSEMRWLPYVDATALVRYDSNRIALWELNQRIHGLGAHDAPP